MKLILNIYGLMGSNSLGLSIIPKLPFLSFWADTPRGRGVARRDPPHVTPRVTLCIHASFRSVAPRVFFGQSITFGFFLSPWQPFYRFFKAHVLSWVKTYCHAKFQRNSYTGLARMMVQTYRQTDISFYTY